MIGERAQATRVSFHSVLFLSWFVNVVVQIVLSGGVIF